MKLIRFSSSLTPFQVWIHALKIYPACLKKEEKNWISTLSVCGLMEKLLHAWSLTREKKKNDDGRDEGSVQRLSQHTSLSFFLSLSHGWAGRKAKKKSVPVAIWWDTVRRDFLHNAHTRGNTRRWNIWWDNFLDRPAHARAHGQIQHAPICVFSPRKIWLSFFSGPALGFLGDK